MHKCINSCFYDRLIVVFSFFVRLFLLFLFIITQLALRFLIWSGNTNIVTCHGNKSFQINIGQICRDKKPSLYE